MYTILQNTVLHCVTITGMFLNFYVLVASRWDVVEATSAHAQIRPKTGMLKLEKRWVTISFLIQFYHRRTILPLCGAPRIRNDRIGLWTSKTKAKFRAFKTEENEIKTFKIAADRYFENITFASLKSPK